MAVFSEVSLRPISFECIGPFKIVKLGLRPPSRKKRQLRRHWMCRRFARRFLVFERKHLPFSGAYPHPPQALNNSETLRLLASIELACYKCKQAVADPRLHTKARRRIERVIKDDRRRRHRRRKDQDAMIDAFSKQTIGSGSGHMEAGPPLNM